MKRSLAEVEREHIRLTLIANDGNMTATALDLEIDRGTLYRKCKGYGWYEAVERVIRGYQRKPVRIVEKG
jgi:DNA-binding NtrC family response regulator